MVETRYNEIYTYPEGMSPEDRTPTNAVIEQIPENISDEELAEEAERKAMEKAENLIDAISNLAEAKVFLKRLVRRLIKNGALP